MGECARKPWFSCRRVRGACSDCGRRALVALRPPLCRGCYAPAAARQKHVGWAGCGSHSSARPLAVDAEIQRRVAVYADQVARTGRINYDAVELWRDGPDGADPVTAWAVPVLRWPRWAVPEPVQRMTDADGSFGAGEEGVRRA